MSELQTTPRLSLFQIEAELLGLLDQREDAEQRHSEAKDMRLILVIEEELAVIDGLIRDYVKAQVRKVDNCAFAIKEFEARAVAKYAESGRLHKAALRDSETAKRIEAMVLEVMQEFGEKKLPGRLFTITRQGNGGQQALTIAQPDLVPLHLRRIQVEIMASDETRVWNMLRDAHVAFMMGDWVPHNALIRQRLEDAERQRQAIIKAAEVAGVSITDEKVAADLNALPGVPGCRLEPRGEQIRIK